MLYQKMCIATQIFDIHVEQVGRLENAIGWYHSHPGYGCWLSGIDVSTQMLNQQFQEPFVAIVVSLWIQQGGGGGGGGECACMCCMCM